MNALRGDTMAYTGTLVVEECCECHTMFAMPADLQRRARESEAVWFYCPLGHKQHYEVSEAQRLRDQLAQARRRARSAEALAVAANDQAAAAERSARAYKGQATRARNRISRGVCPCCNRHFANVERHMAGQHPGYAGESE